jgi:hypothetical protein
MNRKEKPAFDLDNDGEMLPEYDFSKAVRANTAFRIDELALEEFWRKLGYEVERITEATPRSSKAPDFLLNLHGTAVAVCEVKSMGNFDYTVKVNHQDGTATETQHNWQETNRERVLHRADLGQDQLFSWNKGHALANLFVFVNHDPRVRQEEIADTLRAMDGIDATFWFEVEEDGALNSKPSVIASHEGWQRLKDQLGLIVDAKQVLTAAA